MSDYILTVDFGSTFSKFALINKQTGSLCTKTTAPTTQESTIMDGYIAGKEKLLQVVAFDSKTDTVEEFYCSSAWGGFKMVVIGFTSTLTREAARIAALGSGTRIIGSYFYHLDKDDVDKINRLKPDVILLTGGTDGGNTSFVDEMSTLLADELNPVDVIYAGNINAQEKVKANFTNSKCVLHLAANVMPAVNEVVVDEVRQIARDIFMDKILNSNGLDRVATYSKQAIVPTPTAVLRATELWGSRHQRNTNDGTMVIDIGGATTDIHTFGKGIASHMNIFYSGMKTPILKRSVEGDIGMRESAQSVANQIGSENLLNKIPLFKDEHTLQVAIDKRLHNKTYIPTEEAEQALDNCLAIYAMDTAISRHVGRMRKIDSETWQQTGKDTRYFQSVILTGGLLINSASKQKLVKQGITDNKAHDLRPEQPTYYIDQDYLLSAAGVIAPVYPEVASQLLEQHLVTLEV